MFQKICFLLALVFLSGLTSEDNTYKKAYYENGILKSEGWYRFNVKTDYWIYYHENGNIASQGHYEYGKKEKYWYFYDENRVRTEEGHFSEGDKVNWWLFYDKQGRINHKCQLEKGIENGYCLKYSDSKLISAEQYSHGKILKKWTTFEDFEKTNTTSNNE